MGEKEVVYNMINIEKIMDQIKEAMDCDGLQFENYMFLIREYFRCEISKFSLDWFMHSYYSKYIKLHNAMFQSIRWNAMLQSTEAQKYGLGALCPSNLMEKTQKICNYPKLRCTQSRQNRLFRVKNDGKPPNKKRKLNVNNFKLPDKIKLDVNDMEKDMELLCNEVKIPAIKQSLPALKDFNNLNDKNNKTKKQRKYHKTFPLQLEVKGMDSLDLMKKNVIKVMHHNEYTKPIKYIFGGSKEKETESMTLNIFDPIQFEKQLKKRNMNDFDKEKDILSKVMPCDNIYFSKQKIMEIGNQMVRRKNFLNHAEAQKDIFILKEQYQRDYKMNINRYNKDRGNNAEYKRFKVRYNAEINQSKQALIHSLIQPIDDPDIMSVVLEHGVKPFLAAMHCELNKKNINNEIINDTDSNSMDSDSTDDDVPIIQKIKKESKIREYRKENISQRIKKRFSVGPHSMIIPNKNKKEKRKKEKETNIPFENKKHLNIINPIKYESERMLQLSAMLNMEANDDENSESDECWMKYLKISQLKDSNNSMAEIPHIHSCHDDTTKTINHCLLSGDHKYHIPDSKEVQKANFEWRQNFEYEAKQICNKLKKEKEEKIINRKNTIRNTLNLNNKTNIKQQPQQQQIYHHNKKRTNFVRYNNPKQQQLNHARNTINQSPTNNILKKQQQQTTNKNNIIYQQQQRLNQQQQIQQTTNNYNQYQIPRQIASYPINTTSPYHSSSSNVRTRHRGQIGVAGKGRKGRSGKGVSGKSLTQNIRHRSSMNSPYSTPYKPRQNPLFFSRGSQQRPPRTYQQRQRLLSHSQTTQNMQRRYHSIQQQQQYLINQQRIKRSNTPLLHIANKQNNTNNHNQSPLTTNNQSPFPSYYNQQQQRR